MIAGVRYAHTNVIAKDWRSLAEWYVEHFGCEKVLPERDLSGPAMEAGTGVPGATLKGIHLRLPGHGPNGPTIEIFSYGSMPERVETDIHRPGYGHIAFQVADVAAARETVLAAGGRAVGEVVTTPVGQDRVVTWCYVTDPEGNAVELQAWGTAR